MEGLLDSCGRYCVRIVCTRSLEIDGGSKMRLCQGSRAVNRNSSAARLCRPVIRRWHCYWGLYYSSSALSVR